MNQVLKKQVNVPTVPEMLCEQAGESHLDLMWLKNALDQVRSNPFTMCLIEGNPNMKESYETLMDELVSEKLALKMMLEEHGWKIDIDQKSNEWTWHKAEEKRRAS